MFNLANLLREHEGKTLEFKRDLSSPDKVMRTLVAFANGAGGVLLIGVLDGSRKVCGVPDANAAEQWIECRLEDPPANWSRVLPAGVSSRQVLGFDPKTGRPASWPLRYSMISWAASLKKLVPGKYAVRARAVDLNGFAQPEPRSNQKAGKNALELREFEVV